LEPIVLMWAPGAIHALSTTRSLDDVAVTTIPAPSTASRADAAARIGAP
jgi:hypothetical protein